LSFKSLGFIVLDSISVIAIFENGDLHEVRVMNCSFSETELNRL